VNSRERFLAVLNFESGIKNLKYEYGYWAGLIRKWNKNNNLNIQEPPESLKDSDLVRVSLPLDYVINQKNDYENIKDYKDNKGYQDKKSSKSSEYLDTFLMKYFNLDPYPAKFPFDLSPMFSKVILEDKDDYIVFKDNYGITQKILKKGTSAPMSIDYPIKSLKDFYDYMQFYDKDFKKRLPENFDKLALKLKDRDYPIRLGGNPFGFCGMPRHLMGDVNYMLSLYDSPELIKKINEFYLNFSMEYFSEIFKLIEIDWVMIWEDMAFKTGSFISKTAFEEFLTPYYVKFIDFLKQFGIKNIIVDCDGLIDELIPLWISCGVTGVFPMEAVNDLIKIRQEFPKLQMLGGVDKKILFPKDNVESKDIDKELEMVKILLKQGGYIPHIDHAIPMDADWDRFKEYRFKLNEIIEEG